MALKNLTKSQQITFSPIVWGNVFLSSLFLLTVLVLPGREGWYYAKVTLVAIVGALGLGQSKSFSDYKNAFSLLLLGHLFLVSISLFNTQDAWVYSLLGEGRADGFFYQIGLVFYAILAYRLAKDSQRFATKFIRVIIAAAVVQSIIVVFQKLGLDIVGYLIQGEAYGRILGSMGRSGIVAGFLLVAIILCFADTSKLKNPKLLDGISLFFISIISVGLGVADNRTSFIALLVAVFMLLAFYPKKKNSIRILLIILCIYMGQVLIPNKANIGELSQTAAPTSTLQTRFKIWELAFKSLGAIPGAPFIGGGPDAFQLALLRSDPLDELFSLFRMEYAWPASATIREFMTPYVETDPIRSKTWFLTVDNFGEEGTKILQYSGNLDKAHNFLLDRLLSYGIFDSLIWLIIYVFPILGMLKHKAKLAVFPFALIAINIYYLTWFPAIALEPIHLSVAAVAWGILASSKEDQESNKRLHASKP